MDEEGFDFENLKVYQKALGYVDFVYEITKGFPKEELFSLTDQFKRASISICLNIAEGSGGSRIEFNRFLKIARRSIRECIGSRKLPIDKNSSARNLRSNHEVFVWNYPK